MVNFQDPNVVASEICTNAFQSHNIIPVLKNTLFYSGGPEVLARPRRLVYVRLPPPTLPQMLRPCGLLTVRSQLGVRHHS